MILETTYADKKNDQLINDLVGKPYSLIEVFKMRGIGSKRMIIEDASPNFKSYLNTVSDTNYANLELRPNGILVRINKGLRNFTWVVPYYHLSIYKTNGSSIHAQGKFIHFRNDITFKENKNFFDKLLDKKVTFDKQYDFI
ncbi:MAG: hypothetical protein GW839_03935 [Flavobacteriales bacterium]|nr:hypothetical protein [Flavobacteriia bacterium]NCP05248.1 hypothetical protein [Flavobacteriales bacterium]PIV92455.1 MAG: hypothetical protein COW44_14590 [Flavobacteriaceae bacterium CG17_big_fil_post_rev_8_21_14_2_50_33_15]PIY10606.1 MAG: hypothetical protein COZ17_09305 [Flavobacteriaceae bacterium CG_4_10_14_3_um_filter_33_47]PJB19847.1 MAG: hypothetical protein CO117_03235 [Flavobacteriaceae bacterium CG_4_9_14_3_um_filter_33_16]